MCTHVMITYLNLLMLHCALISLVSSVQTTSEKSPYYQHLPDCISTSYQVTTKKTTKRALACPMVKDEIGFLSEWVAFHEMQGFDHIQFYDNNSTSTFAEVEPWVKSGFVTIEREWWVHDEDLKVITKENKFNKMMKIKMMAEKQCKEYGMKNGYEIYASLDMDEYLMPSSPDMTVVDELDYWFNRTTRGVAMIPKYQFPPTPHILEPVNLLTIEAYQTKMKGEGKMNYYTSVSSKVALRLIGGDEYTPATQEFIAGCCDFHGCGNYKFHKNCTQLYKDGEKWKLEGKHKKWLPTPHIHHYARSLEKYIMKMNTWDTAGAGQTYDIYNFLDRVLGYEFDDSAISWTCQMRELLRNRTGEQDYLRPGDMWYRNPEFGKVVSDPHKRGRYGSGFGKYVHSSEFNPYPPGETYQRAHKSYIAPAE